MRRDHLRTPCPRQTHRPVLRKVRATLRARVRVGVRARVRVRARVLRKGSVLRKERAAREV